MAERKDIINSSFLANNSQAKQGQKEIMDMSFITSNSLSVLEEGIRRAHIQDQKINLAICIAFYRIESENLFISAGYNNFHQYIKSQQERTLIATTTAYDLIKIGRVWMEFRDDLNKIGFTEEHGISKLKFFPKKLTKENKQELFTLLSDLSLGVNEFKRQSKNLLTSGHILSSRKEKAQKNHIQGQEKLVGEAIKYIKMKRHNANSTTIAGLSSIKAFFEYLVENEVIDNLLYNLLLDETK